MFFMVNVHTRLTWHDQGCVTLPRYNKSGGQAGVVAAAAAFTTPGRRRLASASNSTTIGTVARRAARRRECGTVPAFLSRSVGRLQHYVVEMALCK
jgi:hypothetical protein